MLFALVAGSPEPANCGLATVVMWICGSYCEWNKHHEEEAGPNFCCSLLLPCSLHPPGYIQEGQEASYDYLLLGVYHRNSSGATPANLPGDRCGSGFPTVLVGRSSLPPPPLGDQEGCSMVGTGQPPPAVRPCHPTPQLPGARRGGRSAATVLPPPPLDSVKHAPSSLKGKALRFFSEWRPMSMLWELFKDSTPQYMYGCWQVHGNLIFDCAHSSSYGFSLRTYFPLGAVNILKSECSFF